MLNEVEKLKIKILSTGIDISERAQKAITQNGAVPLSLFRHHSTTSGIILILPGNIYVNAHFLGKSASSKIKLDFSEEKFYLIAHREKYPVKIMPLPDFIENKINGIACKRFIMTHADRIRVSPIQGCTFRCAYCDIYRTKYEKVPLKTILKAIDLALKDKKSIPKHLLISGGTPLPQDRDCLDEVYEKVTQYLKPKKIPVDIMLTPRKEISFLKKLKKWDVNGLAINLEIYNKTYAERLNPQKAAITREYYFEFIREAVKIFGPGKVRSLLIVGLEPPKDTLRGVKALSKLGCDVVLSPFIPYNETSLAHLKPPSSKTLENIFEESSKITKKSGVKIGPRCIPCQHNTLAFPDVSGSYFFS